VHISLVYLGVMTPYSLVGGKKVSDKHTGFIFRIEVS